MPTVLRIQGYQFYFHANEGSEPPHLHVDSSDALREIDRFFKEEHTVIIPLTMREILDGQIARKLA